MTLYCALGSYEMDKDTGQPVVIRQNKVYRMQPEELILWSSLLWRIYTYDEMLTAYQKALQSSGILAQYNFDSLLQRLITRELVATGSGTTGLDALYELMGDLFLLPLETSLAKKFQSFMKATFINGYPISITRHILSRDSQVLSKAEMDVWRLSKQQILSTAEIIRCKEQGIRNISGDGDIVRKLYSKDDLDYTSISIHERFSDEMVPVLEAVSNLYLKRFVLLETAVAKTYA